MNPQGGKRLLEMSEKNPRNPKAKVRKGRILQTLLNIFSKGKIQLTGRFLPQQPKGKGKTRLKEKKLVRQVPN